MIEYYSKPTRSKLRYVVIGGVLIFIALGGYWYMNLQHQQTTTFFFTAPSVDTITDTTTTSSPTSAVSSTVVATPAFIVMPLDAVMYNNMPQH